MVGSFGRLGVLAELTFKVFPAAAAHATIRAAAVDVSSAAALIGAVQRARFDLEAIDRAARGTVWMRLGGRREALPTRVAALAALLEGVAGGGSASVTRTDDEDATVGARRVSSRGHHAIALWCGCRSHCPCFPAWMRRSTPTARRVVIPSAAISR